jgi:DNA-binding CsgD family transcriptional regulator
MVGRIAERRALDDLIASVRDGISGTVVVLGEAGVGKTTLLDHLSGAADGIVLRAGGVEPEQQLGYAALHRLLLPHLDRVGGLPGPQRDALLAVLGMVSGLPPEPFHVGLATLSLLAAVAAETPLFCVVDDAHWLDQESLDVVAFVCRRLAADSIGMVLSFRENTLTPEVFRAGRILRLEGLSTAEAAGLLDASVPGYLDPDVKQQVLTETSGNPLALLDAAQALTPDQLAGRRPLPRAIPVGERLRKSFARQVESLPGPTRLLLLLVSVAPSNDAAVLWRAVAGLGLSASDVDPALEAGILTADASPTFRHPLIRSAVYASARPADRRRAHAALAEATDRDRDRDRWVWHLASATVGTDEQVARELDHVAARGRIRGEHTAPAALLLRAAELSEEPAARALRLLGSGEALLAGGDVAAAKTRLLDARPALVEPLTQAAALRALAVAEFSLGNLVAVPPMLLQAAARAAASSPADARTIRYEAMITAVIARHHQDGWTLDSVARAVLDDGVDAAQAALPDLIAAALATRLTLGYERAVPLMQAACRALACDDLPDDSHISWAIPGSFLTLELWDDIARDRVLRRLESRERQTGDLRSLHNTLRRSVRCQIWRGDFTAAAALHAEASEISVAIGSPDYGHAMQGELLAWQGKEAELRSIAAQVLDVSGPLQYAGYDDLIGYAMLLLELSLGNYDQALGWAAPLFSDDAAPLANSSLPDLIEAAVRAGDHPTAEKALNRLGRRAKAAGTPWALGVLARSRALVAAPGGQVEDLYRQAITLLGQTLQRTESARTHLLFGEWLRRRRRPAEAAEQLRAAHEMFTEFGARIFADRARAELEAAGGHVRRRRVRSHDALTPQEQQIARLAAAGHTNTEIAGRLYLSTSTVEYHLTKTFRKLGVTSRRQLADALGPRTP